MIDKKDVDKFKMSRKRYIPIYTMIVLLFALIIYIKIRELPLNQLALLGTVVFSILGVGLTEIHRVKDSYHITSEHVEHYSGYIAKAVKKIHLKSITDIDARQGMWERIIGYGSINVQSASGSNHIIVRHVNKPGNFIEILEKRMQKIEDLM